MVMYGRYEAGEQLGQGGFAAVYRARDTVLDRDVALKVLLPHLAGDADIRTRFLNEARALARVRHRNIVTIYDLGEAAGQPFFAMDLIEGKTLLDLLAQSGRLDLHATLDLLRPLASALDYLHGRGVIHRDLKPANLMIAPDGWLTLMDFGIARAMDGTFRTQTGMMLGTPVYMAPEQFHGRAPIGPWTDVYALGVLAYQLLAGRPPFDGDTARIMFGHAMEQPPPLRGLCDGLPEHVYAAIDSALAKAHTDRPQGAGELIRLLGGDGVLPRPSPAVVSAPEPATRVTLPQRLVPVETDRGTLVARQDAPPVVAAPPTFVAPLPQPVPPLSRLPPLPEPDPEQPFANTMQTLAVWRPAVEETRSAAPAFTIPAGTVSTLAGSWTRGYQDGDWRSARFNHPWGLARDRTGAFLVADTFNHRIRKVAPDGRVVTVAGSGEAGHRDGPAAQARFREPRGLAVDAAGALFVADVGNHQIRMISPDGTVTTVAGRGEKGHLDGVASGAAFNSPHGLTIDAQGRLVIADTGNHCVRVLERDGRVRTLAGVVERAAVAGSAVWIQPWTPHAVAVGPDGLLWVTDPNNDCVWVVSPNGEARQVGGITPDKTMADGPAGRVRFSIPWGIAIDQRGTVYVTDAGTHRVRSISPAGAVRTLAGSDRKGFADGPAAHARFFHPAGIVVEPGGNLVLADSGNQILRRISGVAGL